MSTLNWIRFWALGIIWGTSFFWIKIAVGEVSPFVLVGFRTLFGALGLAVVLFSSKPAGECWADIRPWLKTFILVGLFNVLVPFVLISWGQQYIDSGLAAVLNSAVPLFTILLVPLFLPEDRITPARLAGLAVGFAGVVVLFIPKLIESGLDQNILGQGAMILATISYAASVIFVRRKAQAADPRVQAFLQLANASVMIWVLIFTLEHPIRLPALPITWVSLLWLGLLGSCLAYILYFSLIHSIGPTRATMVTYVSPLVGVILGAAFLGEQITWQIVAGGMMILSGIAVANLKSLPFFKPDAEIPPKQCPHPAKDRA